MIILIVFGHIGISNMKAKAKLGSIYMKQMELLHFHSKFLEENIRGDNLSKDSWEDDMKSMKDYTVVFFGNADTSYISSIFGSGVFFREYYDYEEVINNEKKMKSMLEQLSLINNLLERRIEEAYENQRRKLKFNPFFKEYKDRFLYESFVKTYK